MELDDKTAAVDNDFLNNIVQTQMSIEDIISFMKETFVGLGLTAVMHPLVYEKEVLHKDRTNSLFNNHVIYVVDFSDIFQGSSAKKLYYLNLVAQFYNALNGECIPATGEDILTYWKRIENLGEIHSLSMCLTSGCVIFLSDDGDSKYLKNYIESNSLGDVKVYNRDDYFKIYQELGKTKIPRPVRRSLTHAASR